MWGVRRETVKKTTLYFWASPSASGIYFSMASPLNFMAKTSFN
jgi:hypothetical protein